MSQAEKLPWVKIFSSRLSEASRGVKQTEISRKIGVGQSNVSMYLKGERVPALDVFRSLCVSLGVNAGWLLGITDSAIAASEVSSPDVSALRSEVARLWALVESQQRTIEALAKGGVADAVQAASSAGSRKVAAS